MNETLKNGIRYEHKFVVPPSKTVPALYPESEEFMVMPEVFATGFLVSKSGQGRHILDAGKQFDSFTRLVTFEPRMTGRE